MDDQLLPNGDGGSSQASGSLQRSTSLLERIRTQREREARATAENSNVTSGNNGIETNDGTVNVPNYAPIANDAVGGGGEGGNNTSSSFGFSGFSSINFGGFGNSDQNEASQGLLSEHTVISGNDYTMSEYFRMFVGGKSLSS